MLYQPKNKDAVKNLTAAGVCLALCLLLPFLTAQNPQLGNALSLMHIPVLLCGFIAGPAYAALVGFIAPLFRFALFTMPPMPVPGLAMCFELAVYGLATGILYHLLPKKIAYIYVTLVSAMLLGRFVWGIAMRLLFDALGGFGHIPLGSFAVLEEASADTAAAVFTWDMFVAGAFINAIPGIILHIVLIPVIVFALQKAKIID